MLARPAEPLLHTVARKLLGDVGLSAFAAAMSELPPVLSHGKGFHGASRKSVEMFTLSARPLVCADGAGATQSIFAFGSKDEVAGLFTWLCEQVGLAPAPILPSSTRRQAPRTSL
jgi:hypothetical protein